MYFDLIKQKGSFPTTALPVSGYGFILSKFNWTSTP